MERLWIREVRRAARRASAPFARQVAVGCGAAAVGTMVASVLSRHWDGAVAQAVWAALWAVAGYVAIWTGLFIYHLWRYRSSGFRDDDWLARHDDSDAGGALSSSSFPGQCERIQAANGASRFIHDASCTVLRGVVDQ